VRERRRAGDSEFEVGNIKCLRLEDTGRFRAPTRSLPKTFDLSLNESAGLPINSSLYYYLEG